MESPVPTSTRSNEIVGQVLHDHDLSQTWLCDQTGIDSSYMSRILSGQYTVPVEVLKALYARTQDERILQLVMGERLMLVYPDASTPAPWRETVQAAIAGAAISIALLIEHQAVIPPARGSIKDSPRHVVRRGIETAISRLLTARRALDQVQSHPTNGA